MDNDYEEYKVESKKDKISALIKFIILILFLFYILLFSLPKNKEVRLDNYKQISNYVKNNLDDLNKIVIKQKNEDEYDLPSKILYVNDCYYNDGKVKIQFMTYTWWRGSAVGFFYSADDSPVPYQCWNKDVQEYEKGQWKWEDQNGDGEKIIKIQNNWYYWQVSY